MLKFSLPIIYTTPTFFFELLLFSFFFQYGELKEAHRHTQRHYITA